MIITSRRTSAWCIAGMAIALASSPGCQQVHVERQQAGDWLVDAQCEDGRWSAAHFADRGIGEIESPGAGRAVRDLRATSLSLLCLLVDGTTLRGGEDRGAMRKGVEWIRKQQDGEGRIGLHDDPEWVIDHALATFLLCEVAERGRTAALRSVVRSAIDALVAHMQRARVPTDPGLLAWCYMCVDSAKRLEEDIAEYVPAEKRWSSGAQDLLLEVERLRVSDIPAGFRDRAAYFLGEVLRLRLGVEPKKEESKSRIVSIAEPFLDRSWPSDLKDPMALWFVGYGLSQQEALELLAEERALLRARVRDIVFKSLVRDGPNQGSWDPVGSFGDDGGRVCTTAMHELLLYAFE